MDIPDPWFTGNLLSVRPSSLPRTLGNKKVKTEAVRQRKNIILSAKYFCVMASGPEMGIVSKRKGANPGHNI